MSVTVKTIEKSEKTMYNDVYKNLDKMFGEKILYTVDVDENLIWEKYQELLTSAGLNPLYKKRRTYDCSLCKYVIKSLGKVVKINDNLEIETIFDGVGRGTIFEDIFKELSDLIKSKPIKEVWKPTNNKYGKKETYSLIDGVPVKFPHFYSPEVPRHLMEQKLTIYDIRLLIEALDNISIETMNTVMELIDNGLYRGKQYEHIVKTIKEIKEHINKLEPNKRILYVLKIVGDLNDSIIHVKNTSIGKLLQMIEEGKDLEESIEEYLKMVDPTNYKRVQNTAVNIIHVKQFQDYIIQKFGSLDPITKRKHIDSSIIPIQSIIYKPIDKTKEILLDIDVSRSKNIKALEMSIEDFINYIRKTKPHKIEIMVNESNKCYLIGPSIEHEPMFKWGDNYCIMYKGGYVDSVITKKVKEAGGKVDGIIRASLIWDSLCDLDIHCETPCGEIFYNNKRSCGGELDIDMNVSNPIRGAVENIVWESYPTKDGVYKIFVHNYRQRERNNGFKVELVIKETNEHYLYEYNKHVRDNEKVYVCSFEVKNGNVVNVIHHIEPKQASNNNISDDGKWHPVEFIWKFPFTNDKGFTHILFNVKGMEPDEDEETLPYLPEYFKDEISRKYKRIIELLSKKYKVSITKNGCISLGFTKGRKQSAYVRLNGKQVIKINF